MYFDNNRFFSFDITNYDGPKFFLNICTSAKII